MTRKWTKIDIRTLRSQLDTFMLQERMYYPKERICAAIASKRSEIIVGNLRGFRDMLAERAAKNEEAWKHFESHPTIYGSSTPEMVERFKGLADQDAKGVRKANRLIERVQSEGLPVEVAGYVPEECIR